jgi:hypothetical protein
LIVAGVIEPFISLTIGLLFVCVLSDFLLDRLSHHWLRATRQWQLTCVRSLVNWPWFVFQLINWRKKTFFVQLPTLIKIKFNSYGQVFRLVTLSLAGMSLSLLLLSIWPWPILLLLIVVGVILLFSSQDALRSVGLSALLLAVYTFLIMALDQSYKDLGLDIFAVDIPLPLAMVTLFIMVLFFKTPAPFLITLAVFHFKFQFSLSLLLGLLFAQTLIWSLVGLYYHRKSPKFYWYLLIPMLSFAVVGGLSCGTFFYLVEPLDWLSNGASFVQSYHWVLSVWLIYLFCGLVAQIIPSIFPQSWFDWKINSEVREDVAGFSPVISMQFLYHQWDVYKKHLLQIINEFETSGHFDSQQLAQSKTQYEDIQEICFLLGRKDLDANSVQEVMEVYRSMNLDRAFWESILWIYQDGLLTLKGQGQDQLRQWLMTQLKIFRHLLTSLGEDLSFVDLVEKSYDDIEKFPESFFSFGINKSVFYSLTESLSRRQINSDVLAESSIAVN